MPEECLFKPKTIPVKVKFVMEDDSIRPVRKTFIKLILKLLIVGPGHKKAKVCFIVAVLLVRTPHHQNFVDENLQVFSKLDEVVKFFSLTGS